MDAPGATTANECANTSSSERDMSPARSRSPSNARPGEHAHRHPASDDGSEASYDKDDEEEEEEEEEEDSGDEDEEPRLKYAYLTKHLGSVYRKGDATSTFLVAGDKMVRFSLKSAS